MRKFFAFLFGPGTALLYALLGVITFWTQWHWGMTDKDWQSIMTLVGLGFLISQIIQVIILKGTTLWGGVADIGLCFFNAIVGIVALTGVWGASGDTMEYIIYLGFIFADACLLVVTVKVYKLTSEFSNLGR